MILAAIAVISCGRGVPLVAKNYHPHSILTAKEAIIAAQIQYEEFTPARHRQEEWLNTFKARHIGTKWVLDGQLGRDRMQIQLNEKNGRVLCGFVID